MFGRLLQDLRRQLVALAQGLAQIAALEIGDALAVFEEFRELGLLAFLRATGQFAENGGSAGQSLETAVVATAALRPTDLDDHVPHLARGAIET